jgi:hypothetical protein
MGSSGDYAEPEGTKDSRHARAGMFCSIPGPIMRRWDPLCRRGQEVVVIPREALQGTRLVTSHLRDCLAVAPVK